MCPGASPASRDGTIPTVLHGSTLCSPGQQANVQCQDDMAICSYTSFARSGEILYHFICGVNCQFACGSSKGVLTPSSSHVRGAVNMQRMPTPS
ncbi:hypothetical protein EPR50_G00086480 [Perca flavescens]|uniref:Uncharacterized protein n=1 Tax=Perca flavescens TaxID=8167 RepID=A0A484D448_PERFV|nr:hypothetical protein EPR50_G00086480 [Perca flavescens]